MDDITHLPAEYPDPSVRDGRVFFLQLRAFEVARVLEGGQSLSLKAEKARISAPMERIADAFDEVPFFHSDNAFCPDDLTFEDKARLVYLASQFSGQCKQNLYKAFKAYWLRGNARSPKGVQIRFMKDGVEDMTMNI
mgnify:CR=1 FL=1